MGEIAKQEGDQRGKRACSIITRRARARHPRTEHCRRILPSFSLFFQKTLQAFPPSFPAFAQTENMRGEILDRFVVVFVALLSLSFAAGPESRELVDWRKKRKVFSEAPVKEEGWGGGGRRREGGKLSDLTFCAPYP